MNKLTAREQHLLDNLILSAIKTLEDLGAAETAAEYRALFSKFAQQVME